MELAVAVARILSRFYTTWKPWATGLQTQKYATVTTMETWQLSLPWRIFASAQWFEDDKALILTGPVRFAGHPI